MEQWQAENLKEYLLSKGFTEAKANRIVRQHYKKVVEPRMLKFLIDSLAKEMAEEIDRDLIKALLLSPRVEREV